MKIKWFIVSVWVVMVGSLSGQAVSQTISEDWESGDFSSLSWERPGVQYRWEITSEGAHNGRYCARSGNYYTLNTESVLQLGVYLTESGNLSYYRKVFSAEGSGGFLFWAMIMWRLLVYYMWIIVGFIFVMRNAVKSGKKIGDPESIAETARGVLIYAILLAFYSGMCT